jgi:hypothetical protein
MLMDVRERCRQHHPYDDLEIEAVAADRVDADDGRIIDRIVTAYRRSVGNRLLRPGFDLADIPRGKAS